MKCEVCGSTKKLEISSEMRNRMLCEKCKSDRINAGIQGLAKGIKKWDKDHPREHFHSKSQEKRIRIQRGEKL